MATVAAGSPPSGTVVGTTDTQTLTNKTITQPVLTLEQGAAVAPTAEGRIAWDTDDNKLKIGDGASTQTVTPDGALAVTVTLNFVIDGGGSAITTGVKGFVRIPFAWTGIAKATLLADQSGSIVIDIWKDTYANYPPTDADSITAAAPPTISSATKSEDATLTGWTTTGSAGDILGFNVDSITTVTRVTLALDLVRAI